MAEEYLPSEDWLVLQEEHGKETTVFRRKQKRERVAQIERQFKANHARLILFFTCVLFIHAAGIYYFTRGFLLTRLVLNDRSKCAVSPIQGPAGQVTGNLLDGCWHPKTFDKAVIIIVDALRYDFTLPWTTDGPHPHYRDALNVLYETASEQPHDAFLLPFIADPPTATLQRLKGLTTGNLPTFIDAGSNFAGTAIEEDNLVAQLREAGKTLVHLGDDTWHSLFPGYFDANLSRPYDSFNVWDLHTVDDGVTQHLFPLLHPSNTSKWDVIFGHYLGVDHAGHRYGPDHPAMAAKLRQMDRVIRDIITVLDDSTLLVVMGDHGMDVKGDHGGESDDEVQAAIWMYSKKGIFGRTSREAALPPQTAKERHIWQIDLVPTLSLLLGTPIPFNNLGAPIKEAFIGPHGNDWANLAAVNHLTGAQVKQYQQEYAVARGLPESTFSHPLSLWEEAYRRWKDVSLLENPSHSSALWWFDTANAFSAYQAATLRICKNLWARFDEPSMIGGAIMLLLGVILVAWYAGGGWRGVRDITWPPILQPLIRSMVDSFLKTNLQNLVLPSLYRVKNATLYVAGNFLPLHLIQNHPDQRDIRPIKGDYSFWTWVAVVFTLCPAIGFASNSYTIWEDEILLFFLSSFGTLSLFSSLRQSCTKNRAIGVSQSITFIVLTRIASLSRLCREEQMPYCRSTYYASASSSTSANWQLLLPFALSLIIPIIIRSYYQVTRSYQGPAQFWIGVALPIGMLLTAFFWTLDTADDADWFGLKEGVLKSIRMVIARLVLGLSLGAGTVAFYRAEPCVKAVTSSEPLPPNSATASKSLDSTTNQANTLDTSGSSNAYGTHYFLLLINTYLALILLQKPMGHLSLGILTWQILCLLEILASNALTTSVIGPVTLGLLGNYHFFKTGHQATLSSIQWEAAFIPLKQVRYPWSPLLVVGNAMAAQILCTVAVPLVALWRRRPAGERPSLVGADVGRALCAYLAYHGVVNLATTVGAYWLRRHLMLYRIFSPRWMVGSVVLLVCDLVGLLVALGGFRCTALSVKTGFGWEDSRSEGEKMNKPSSSRHTVFPSLR
ncbi:MAG: mannose-ethanolamine phosphotransferase gpi13 [Peltula sp. TS41687]|nr:MAG: mannose-ethanolamine phosphotransferase gpi13 [Peltula sp. TS41687]